MDNELLQKIKQLAERGVGGEKENAEKMLKLLMKKYNISEDELNSEKIDMFEIKVKTDFESRLLYQIRYSVCGDLNDEKKLVYYPKNKKHLYLFSTKAEFLEIEAKFSFYREIWKNQLEILFRAFIRTERLYPSSDLVKETNEKSELTPEDYEVIKMDSGMKKHSYCKQISYK